MKSFSLRKTKNTVAPPTVDRFFDKIFNNSFLVKRLNEDSIIPTKGSENSAGWDLYSTDEIELSKGCRCTVSTGISVAIPEGYYGRIAPRSGHAVKFGIDVMAGVIDSDYRGEIKVVLINLDDSGDSFNVVPKTKIAQLIIEKIYTDKLIVVEDLPETIRDVKGGVNEK